MARPSKLTRVVEATVAGHVAEGIPLDTAAQAAGITGRTLHHWMVRGEKDSEELELHEVPEAGTYASFFQSVTRGRARATIDLFMYVKRGDHKDARNTGKSAQWLLERTRGKQYQPRIAMKVEEETDVFWTVAQAVLPTEHYAALLGAMADVDDEGVPRVLSGTSEAADVITH